MVKFFLDAIKPKNADNFDVFIKAVMNAEEVANLLLKTDAQDNSLSPNFGNRGKQLPQEN